MKSKIIVMKIQMLLLAMILPLLLNSFTVPSLLLQTDAPDTKKECMLEVLESLEAGKQYIKDKSWGEPKFISIDISEINIPDFGELEFDIDFPELVFDKFNMEEFEERMEELEERIEEKMEAIIKRIEEIHQKFEKRD